MKHFSKKSKGIVAVMAMALIAVGLWRCSGTQTALDTSEVAKRVYVNPGQFDELYAFMSGGFSGQLSVYGLPSGRLFKVIPVFAVDGEKGYGFSEETKPLLNTTFGFVPWDDAHHPKMSQTNGEQDGRWIFINGNNTPRVARIDLTSFETQEIIQIPNSGGNHASPFLTPNTEYVVASTRFSVPIPQKDVGIGEFAKEFGGTISFVRVDPSNGRMSVAFQILMPGFDYDLAHAGKGPSDGWAFFTCYNSEQAHSLLEVNASKNDKDFIAAINWKVAEQFVANGKAKTVKVDYMHNWMDDSRVAKSEKISEVKMIDPRDCPGLVYYIPTPKSPHGVDVDPSGEYLVAGGKLATVIPVHSFTKLKQAIDAKEFDGEVGGIPVVKYDKVVAGEVQNPGLGPLHTEFDGNGYAYTSMFLSSEIVKWKLGTWEVVDRVPTYYSIGHLLIPGGDTRKPYGKYVIALNKITKGRFLPTGPEEPQSAQLYDISGDKMKLLLDFPTVGEPHYAQACPADLITKGSLKIFPIEANKNPHAIKNINDARVVREGKTVHVYLGTVRSHFTPDNIEGVSVGDDVYFHVTNLEQDWDIPHGFAVMGGLNAELLVMPGDTRTLLWKPQAVGVYPFYCTDFCSALHQEMQGYIRVSPQGAKTPLTSSLGS